MPPSRENTAASIEAIVNLLKRYPHAPTDNYNNDNACIISWGIMQQNNKKYQCHQISTFDRVLEFVVSGTNGERRGEKQKEADES